VSFFGGVDFYDGVLGEGKNGVIGRSRSPTDSGVWGDNIASTGGFGVSGSSAGGGVGVSGTNASFGVGVSGHCAGGGVGISGSSVNGYGGEFGGGSAQLYLIPNPSSTTGPPTTFDHKRGEFYVDSEGSLFYCKADGRPPLGGGIPGFPGTWVKLA
jgi:hypothetical protein